MKTWVLRYGSGEKNVSFRGKGGHTRKLRADEIVVAKVSEISEDHVSIHCVEVLGRKAWRVDGNGLQFIKDKIVALNSGKLTQLETLETLEVQFESGKNGGN